MKSRTIIGQSNYKFIASRETLEEFIAAWEAGVLPKAEWTHAAHIAVGAYYGVRYPSTAYERTRNGILRYNEAVRTSNTETSGYHETLTHLWSLVLAKTVEGFTDPWEAVSHAVEKLAKFGTFTRSTTASMSYAVPRRAAHGYPGSQGPY
jgi:hypothetical protein